MIKNPPAKVGDIRDMGSLVRKIPWRRQGNPLQDSCLENPMDRGAWWATVHGVSKSQIQLSDFTFAFYEPRGVLESERRGF